MGDKLYFLLMDKRWGENINILVNARKWDIVLYLEFFKINRKINK